VTTGPTSPSPVGVPRPDGLLTEPVDGTDSLFAGDRVRLTLPADAAFGRIARLTASGLALRKGFTYEEVEDLRRAVDEAVRLLVGPGRGALDRLTVTFSIEDAGLAVELVGRDDGRRLPPLEPAACARFVARVASLVDTVRVEPDEGRVDLTKALAGLDAD
jgi:anti-sigma regulatory factor (Ser/Thr protein kinase)